MAINLPNQRQLPGFQSRQQPDQTDQIISVLGQNPYATGITAASTALSDVLKRRAELKRQAMQVNALEGAYKLPEGSLGELPTETAAAVGKVRYEQEAKTQEALDKVKKIRSLEERFGYKPNELGDDYDEAKLKVQADQSMSRIQEMNKGKSISDDNIEFKLRDKYTQESVPYKEALSAYKQAKVLTNSGTGVGDQTLVRLLVRVAEGKGGKVSDSDVDGFIQSQPIDSRVKSAILKNFHKGELFAPETRKYIHDLLDAQFSEQTTQQEERNARYSELVNLYKVRPESLGLYKTGKGEGNKESPEQRKARLLQELQGAQ